MKRTESKECSEWSSGWNKDKMTKRIYMLTTTQRMMTKWTTIMITTGKKRKSNKRKTTRRKWPKNRQRKTTENSKKNSSSISWIPFPLPKSKLKLKLTPSSPWNSQPWPRKTPSLNSINLLENRKTLNPLTCIKKFLKKTKKLQTKSRFLAVSLISQLLKHKPTPPPCPKLKRHHPTWAKS